MSRDIQPGVVRSGDAYNLEALRKLAEGRFVFSESLPISGRSRYGDDVWSWQDSSNLRLNQYSKATLTINWAKYRTRLDLSPEIIADLKKYALLRYAHSKAVFPQTMKNAHPASITREVVTVASFLSHVRRHMMEEVDVWINSLSEIEVTDLEGALSTYPMKASKCLRKALRYLGGESFGRHLACGRLRWNEHDITALEWKFKEPESYQRLPEGAFRLLSNAGTADVKQFLLAIGFEPQDTTKIGREGNLYLSEFGNFREFFKEYTEFRVALKRKEDRSVISKYTAWVASLGDAVGRLAKLVDRARMAAQVIVTMYTGGRASELGSFKTECLQRRGDVWVMVGTLIKHQDIHAPVDQDDWVAIPIVRDAVRALQELARVAGSGYLFHGIRRARVEERSMSAMHLSRRRLTPYLRLVDAEKKWEHLCPHAHQFRNSIVFEMRKAGLGLPFITYQLKHLFNELEGSANDTSLIYGGIGGEAVQRAVEEANLEALREIYHPDSPVAGGAAEELRRRRAAYFQGMAVQGVQVDDVLRFLAREGGMPLTDVGLGYCQGKKKINVDGVKKDPPCIGGLRCNPLRCEHGIIPKHKRSAWKTLSVENRRRAQDPEFAHAKAELEEAAEEAEAVVRYLDDDPVARFLGERKERKGGGK